MGMSGVVGSCPAFLGLRLSLWLVVRRCMRAALRSEVSGNQLLHHKVSLFRIRGGGFRSGADTASRAATLPLILAASGLPGGERQKQRVRGALCHVGCTGLRPTTLPVCLQLWELYPTD